MLSGVLLIVIIIIFILQGTIGGANNTMTAQQNTYNTSVSVDIVPQYTANLIVMSQTGGLGGPYPCCENFATPGCTGVIINCTGTLNCYSSRFDRKVGRCV